VLPFKSMARILAERLQRFKEIRITQPVQSNGGLCNNTPGVAEKLRNHYYFYPWNEKISEYRLMTSWDTQEEEY